MMTIVVFILMNVILEHLLIPQHRNVYHAVLIVLNALEKKTINVLLALKIVFYI